MIFVTVGTSVFTFERLLHGIDELDVDDEVVVQYGSSTFVPRADRAEAFMPYAEIVENMRRARAVVAHGGVGSILTALHVGHCPIVVPRIRRYEEAVDDHQLDLASRLWGTGLVRLVEDVAELPRALENVVETSFPAVASSLLAAAVGRYVDSILGPAGVA